MMITWSTFNDTKSLVQYGMTKANYMSSGSSTKFVDGGPAKHYQYIHRVKLSKLIPGTKYGNYRQRNTNLSRIWTLQNGRYLKY